LNLNCPVPHCVYLDPGLDGLEQVDPDAVAEEEEGDSHIGRLAHDELLGENGIPSVV
jgi:hypothetical protein